MERFLNDDDFDFSDKSIINQDEFICLNNFSNTHANYIEDRIDNNNDTCYHYNFIKLMQNSIDDDFHLKNEIMIYNKKDKENVNKPFVPINKNDPNENSNNLFFSKNEEKNINLNDFINDDEREYEENTLIKNKDNIEEFQVITHYY